MTDYANLSKEELVALLSQKTTPAQTSSPPTRALPARATPELCQYVPSRPANSPQCTEDSSTPYGFCKKHSRTVQAKRARELYEANELIEEIQRDRGDTDMLPPVSDAAGETTGSSVASASESKSKSKTPPAPVEKPKSKTPPKPKLKTPPKSKAGQQKTTTRKKTIRPNYWNRYEDTDTHIVFDPATKCAYGVQEPTGRVTALKAEHVEVCKKNGWNYNLPYASEDEISDSDDESIRESDFDSDDDVDSDDDSDVEDSDDDVGDSDDDSDVEDSDDDSDVEDSDSDDDSDEDSDDDSDY